MAKPTTKKSGDTQQTVQDTVMDDFSSDLIKAINKEHNDKIAFNLGVDDAPTHVHRWISTGSRQLDYIIGNRRGGGMPEGRIVEIQGPPGIGKSTLMAQICFRSVPMHRGNTLRNREHYP
jgi:RecA/RadA recombinase